MQPAGLPAGGRGPAQRGGARHRPGGRGDFPGPGHGDLYREKAVYGGEVYLFHADREELAQQVAGRILAIDPAAKITIGWVGAVIGIYTGAGCLGLAFLQK